MSASARIKPRPNAPPAGSRAATRWTRSSGRPAAAADRQIAADRTAGRTPTRDRLAAGRRPWCSSSRLGDIGIKACIAARRGGGFIGADVRGSRGTIPLPAASSSGVKKPCAAVAHRQERLAVDRRVELEPEQDRLPLAEEVRDPDVVADHLHRRRGARGERSRSRPAAGRRPAPWSRSRSPGSRRGTGRPGPPRSRCTVRSGRRRDTTRPVDHVLGDHPPSLQRPRLALDRQDPVDQHQAARRAAGPASGSGRSPRIRDRGQHRSTRRRTPGILSGQAR